MRSMLALLAAVLAFTLTGGGPAGTATAFPATAAAASGLPDRTTQLETRVDKLDRQLKALKSNTTGLGGLAFLFGVVCALWAQNSGRNAWLWFFLGAIFSAVTTLVLLWKNAEDRRNRRAPADQPL